MRGTVLYGPRDIRFEDRESPAIEQLAEGYRTMDERRAIKALYGP